MELEDFLMKMHSIRYLEQRFTVTSTFYKKLVCDRLHNCRHITKIARRGTVKENCEALIILTCPKQSIELEQGMLHEVNPTALDELPFKHIPIDLESSGVMYVMDVMDWDHVQVMYLTDLIYYNEARFQHDLFFMRKNHTVAHHAISHVRKNEWTSLLANRIPIIAAWGTRKEFDTAAKEAHAVLTQYGKVYGVQQMQNEHNYHAFIKGKHINEQIIEKIANQLKPHHFS